MYTKQRSYDLTIVVMQFKHTAEFLDRLQVKLYVDEVLLCLDAEKRPLFFEIKDEHVQDKLDIMTSVERNKILDTLNAENDDGSNSFKFFNKDDYSNEAKYGRRMKPRLANSSAQTTIFTGYNKTRRLNLPRAYFTHEKDVIIKSRKNLPKKTARGINKHLQSDIKNALPDFCHYGNSHFIRKRKRKGIENEQNTSESVPKY